MDIPSFTTSSISVPLKLSGITSSLDLRMERSAYSFPAFERSLSDFDSLPPLVLYGVNPPYAVSSFNTGTYTGDLSIQRGDCGPDSFGRAYTPFDIRDLRYNNFMLSSVYY